MLRLAGERRAMVDYNGAMRHAIVAGLFAVAAAAACSSTREEPLPSIPCASHEIAEAMDPAEDVTVFVDEDVPPEVQRDLASYLGRLWGAPVAVNVGAPEGGSGDAVWLSAGEAARALATPPAEGYALVRRDQGSRKVLVAAAATTAELASAAYALLEELGVRFFHPMQELVPELGGARFPRTLDARRAPMTRTRGLHVHLLHPIEYFRTLHEPGEEHLAEAKRLVDWLVKTGQNHLQWPVLGSVPWEAFAAHARQIVSYAHARGVTVGANLNVHHASSHQRGYVLIRDDAHATAQIQEGLDRAMEVPWDDVELSFGEFVGSDPDQLLAWLDVIVTHMAEIAPGTNVAFHNHIGNFPHMWLDYRGERTFFYHVPKHADVRLGQTVHTVFWHDLYRESGMYQHPNFHLQREFILSQLAEHQGARRVRYYPESAYWIASDIDVPAFLPEYIESRWMDIHGLDRDIRAAGLPPLDGHTLYTSGHEWGYWMTDYLVAKMLWEPGAPLERFVAHYGSAYGSCAGDVTGALSRFIELQRLYLFDKKLVSYVSGEDAAVDLSTMVGLNHRHVRRSFDDVVTAEEHDRAAFEGDVLADLDTLVREIRPLEDGVAARCRGADAVLTPWCDELRDGVHIVRLRLEHSLLLYRALLAHARGDGRAAAQRLKDAVAKTGEARVVVEGRAQGYRFDLERLTGAYANPTIYPFGYLRQAHTLCLWHRQNEQARRIVEENLIGSTTGLPSCLD
jgi:hypothetical protein